MHLPSPFLAYPFETCTSGLESAPVPYSLLTAASSGALQIKYNRNYLSVQSALAFNVLLVIFSSDFG